MPTLDNLRIIGVYTSPDAYDADSQEGMIHSQLNLWGANKPAIIAVPYRGGYIGGFNDMTTFHKYLLIAGTHN